MIRRQPFRHAIRPALMLGGFAAYAVFAELLMLLVFRVAGA